MTHKYKVNEKIKVTSNFELNTKANGLEYGEFETIVSNSGLDRHGEKILLEGIDLKHIKKNPTVLWAHEYSALPIGKIKKIWNDGKNLMARVKLSTQAYEFADTVYKLILDGAINAVSIGGLVKEFDEDDYSIIKALEMMELSVVPVGAHPDALISAKTIGKKLGIEAGEVKEQYEDFVRAALNKKLKALPKNEIEDHIKSLKSILSVLESNLEEQKPKKVKRVVKVVLVS